MVLAGVPSSALLFISLAPARLQLVHALLNVIMTCTMVVAVVNLTEMLPYNTRFFAAAAYCFTGGLANALATLHVYYGFSPITLGLICCSSYFVGMLIVIYVIRDSICHLNIRNDADLVEKMIRQEETRLMQQDPEGDVYYHTQVAKKVFEDLVYLDKDELKVTNFFKRLWRNPAMAEIVLAMFQAFSAGIHVHEYKLFRKELFLGMYMVTVDRLLGFIGTSLLMFYMRKTHRVKALAVIAATALFLAGARHSIVHYDRRNGCAGNLIVEGSYEVYALILNVLHASFTSCMQLLILLHFMETTPSTLRMTVVLMVYIPLEIAGILIPMMLGNRISRHFDILPVYLYHLIIIGVTLTRARSKLPFPLYMVDLMPISEREPPGDDDEDSSDEAERRDHEEIVRSD